MPAVTTLALVPISEPLPLADVDHDIHARPLEIGLGHVEV